jgi:hypothetical protein
MDTAKEVQVRACKCIDGEVSWTPEENAEFFSVYSGEPGAFKWNADFDDKLDALVFAQNRALRLGTKFVDRIGEV